MQVMYYLCSKVNFIETIYPAFSCSNNIKRLIKITLSVSLSKEIRPWFYQSQFALFLLFLYSKLDNTICRDSLRLGVMKRSVSVYWKIARSLQQILPSSALFAKQFEDLERRFHHHIPLWVSGGLQDAIILSRHDLNTSILRSSIFSYIIACHLQPFL